ncbi:hypothetical protein BDDG_11550 [Blastomyces dermatitidis ATCC 18188]|uniref:Uncharacterized protein n=1 Tax=Ajellomyces dermatitidis (strain ATCC 18188 / CBS 674.68) TaxID=653446 RepID=A0A0J9HBQ7_AJEDA|nr:hypothetical protein BDDG_11550 [Blastomyces dermatitidis ATCC 18188]
MQARAQVLANSIWDGDHSTGKNPIYGDGSNGCTITNLKGDSKSGSSGIAMVISMNLFKVYILQGHFIGAFNVHLSKMYDFAVDNNH